MAEIDAALVQEFKERCLQLHGPARSVDLFAPKRRLSCEGPKSRRLDKTRTPFNELRTLHGSEALKQQNNKLWEELMALQQGSACPRVSSLRLLLAVVAYSGLLLVAVLSRLCPVPGLLLDRAEGL